MSKTGTEKCKRNALNKPAGKDCTCVTFKGRTKNPVHVWRCEKRSLRAHNRRQCRRGGAKSTMKSYRRGGRTYKVPAAKQFVRCHR